MTQVDALAFYKAMFDLGATIHDISTGMNAQGKRRLIVRWSCPSRGNQIVGKQWSYPMGVTEWFLEQ